MHKIYVYTLIMFPKAKSITVPFTDCKGANNNTYIFKAKY